MKFALPILRTRVGTRTEVQVVVEPVVFIPTHWLGRRRVVCSGDGCRACLADEARTYVYAIVDHLAIGKFYLLEVTEASWLATRILVSRSSNSSLLMGDVLSLSRKHKRSPARVEVVDHKPVREISPELTTLRAVAALYRLPVPGVTESATRYGTRCRTQVEAKQIPLLRELGIVPGPGPAPAA